MPSESWQVRYFVDAPAHNIYAHLAEPESYIGLSPLVTAVSNVEHLVDSQGRPVVRYVSVERFHFLGIFNYDNKIRVDMTLAETDREIISEVASPMNVHVRFVFMLQPNGSGTDVIEDITAEMPGLVKGFVMDQAKQVQQARMRILKERMERS